MFELGERRVQDLGGSKFINLPREWVKNQGIDRGDTIVFFLMKDGSLRIKQKNEGGKNE